MAAIEIWLRARQSHCQCTKYPEIIGNQQREGARKVRAAREELTRFVSAEHVIIARQN